MNLAYHKKADVFCTAIVTFVTIILQEGSCILKLNLSRVSESCKQNILVFLKAAEKKPI
jgi:hypothetical protein